MKNLKQVLTLLIILKASFSSAASFYVADTLKTDTRNQYNIDGSIFEISAEYPYIISCEDTLNGKVHDKFVIRVAAKAANDIRMPGKFFSLYVKKGTEQKFNKHDVLDDASFSPKGSSFSEGGLFGMADTYLSPRAALSFFYNEKLAMLSAYTMENDQPTIYLNQEGDGDFRYPRSLKCSFGTYQR